MGTHKPRRDVERREAGMLNSDLSIDQPGLSPASNSKGPLFTVKWHFRRSPARRPLVKTGPF